jgi:CHAD domain-containing protein
MRRAQLHQDFLENVLEFQDLLREVHGRSGAKKVHQLRVTTRKIRSVLWLAKNNWSKKISDRLGQLAHGLGTLRELQMAIKDAHRYQIPYGRFQRRKKHAKKKLKKLLSKKMSEEIAGELLLTALEDKIGIVNPNYSRFRSRYQKLVQKVITRSEKLQTADDFHELRIYLKKARYILEAFGFHSRTLKETLDILGRVHDLDVLLSFVGKNRKVLEDRQELVKRLHQRIPAALQVLKTGPLSGLGKSWKPCPDPLRLS